MDLGLSIGDEEDYTFASCVLYYKIQSMIDDGYLKINSSNNLTHKTKIMITELGENKFSE